MRRGVAVTLRDTTGKSMGAPREPWSLYTVEGLFNVVEQWARRSDVVEVAYDPTDGYPAMIRGDTRIELPDDWFWVRASRLAPASLDQIWRETDRRVRRHDSNQRDGDFPAAARTTRRRSRPQRGSGVESGMSEASRPFLTAQWRNLIIVTYAVDPTRIIDRVPAGTTLDSWHGQTLVSVLGFQFQNARVLGTAIPFHQDFEEVNLRFYVRRATETDVRSGVVFIREMVPRPIVGGMARLLYREPYVVVPMRSTVNPGPPPDVEYQWDAGGHWCTVAGTAVGGGAEVAPGSLEEFLTVRHWGYNGEPGKVTLEYQVDHPRWRVWHVRDPRADYNAQTLCDKDLAPYLQKPISCLIADGSPVTIHWRTQITN